VKAKSQSRQNIPLPRARCYEAMAWADQADPTATARPSERIPARAVASASRSVTSASCPLRVSAQLTASAAWPRNWSRSLVTWPSSSYRCCISSAWEATCSRADEASVRADAAASDFSSSQSSRRSTASALCWARHSLASVSATPLEPQRFPNAALTAEEQRLSGAHVRELLKRKIEYHKECSEHTRHASKSLPGRPWECPGKGLPWPS
jgi:hypothetical protein